MTRHARSLHLTTAVVATAALLLQLVLVVNGEAVLDETNAPPTTTAVGRYFSYFTIQSNLLVAIGAAVDAGHVPEVVLLLAVRVAPRAVHVEELWRVARGASSCWAASSSSVSPSLLPPPPPPSSSAVAAAWCEFAAGPWLHLRMTWCVVIGRCPAR